MDADLLERLDWDNPVHREHFCRQWIRAPRRNAEDAGPVFPPRGYRPCPVPSVGRHLFEPGHIYTGDGRCWVPEERP